MDRDPGYFPHDEATSSSAGDADAWTDKPPPCPGIPSTDEQAEEADARAMADIAAGRTYPHGVVGEWLKTWGKPGRKTFHDWLAERNG